MSCLVGLLGSLVGWCYPSLDILVNLLQFYSVIIDFVRTVRPYTGSVLVWSLGVLLCSKDGPPVGLQLILDIPYGSKLRYPDLMEYPSRYTLALPPELIGVDFAPPPSGTCPTLPRQRGRNFLYVEAKVNTKVKCLVVLGIFFSRWHYCMLLGLNILVTPPLWYLINFLNCASFSSTNLASSAPQIITDFSEVFPSWGG